ncbi:MAG: cell division topological specificity factor MinE [Candidatus Thiodiazotropha sp. 6PLUC2]
MGLLNYFKSKKSTNSASVARERLQILVAHDRAGRDAPSYLPQLQRDILKVLRKYVAVEPGAVNVNVEHDEHHEILELNIVLPEGERKTG